jgi:hypothetical protein
MDLCNWGQYGYMIDNPKASLIDVMNMIKTRIFDRVQTDVVGSYGDRKLIDKQFEIIKNAGLFTAIRAVLEHTTGKKGKRPTAEVLLAQNSDVPDKPKEPSAVDEDEKEDEVDTAPVNPVLTDEELKKKINDMLETFVNALVIKSDQPWKGMTFEMLIRKFIEDKKTSRVITTDRTDERFMYKPNPKKNDTHFNDELFASEICACDSTQECGKTFSNLYDTVFCELKSYAITVSTKQIAKEFQYSSDGLSYIEKATERAKQYANKRKGDEVGEVETKTIQSAESYSLATHEDIMKLMEDIFVASSALEPDWTAYIDSLIHDLTKRV